MAATSTARKTTKPRAKAVQTTISKSEALALVKSGELNPNKYRRPCILCEEIVPAGEGVLGGNKTEGWWAAHIDGECVGQAVAPESASPKLTLEQVRSLPIKELRFLAKGLGIEETRKLDILAEMSKQGYFASTESAAEDVSAGKVDSPNVPVRGKKRSAPVAAAKKTVARRTVKPNTGSAESATPAKKTPARKLTAAQKSQRSKEDNAAIQGSASDDNAVPAELMGLVNALTEQIKAGTLDEVLGMIDDAISERLDASAPAPKPTPAKRASTTTAKSKAEKLAPVTRSKGSSESASAAPAKPVPVRPRKGYDYMVNPTLKLKLAGQKVTFKSYVADTENKKASCTLLDEFDGKPAGSRIIVPTRALVKIVE